MCHLLSQPIHVMSNRRHRSDPLENDELDVTRIDKHTNIIRISEYIGPIGLYAFASAKHLVAGVHNSKASLEQQA